MTGDDHVDRVTLDRLFARTGGRPLGVEEFDALHGHLADCATCRDEFDRRRSESLRGDDRDRSLSDGQAATILNVVLERGRRIEAERAAGVAAAPALAAAPPRLRRPRFAFVTAGFGGALAAAAAALLLWPVPDPRRGGPGDGEEWGVKGGADAPAERDLFCFDERTQDATPLPGERAVCPAGKTVSVDARSIAGFAWISVAACDRVGCKLLDSARADAARVSLSGPTMAAGGRWKVFTIWSAAPVRQADLDAAVEAVRAKGGDPNAVDALSLRQPNRQLAATVAADRAPS